MLVTFDKGDIFWMLVPDANVKRKKMLVTKTAKPVTNISKLSPKQFVSNIRHQHRCSQTHRLEEDRLYDSVVDSISRKNLESGKIDLNREGLRLKIESVETLSDTLTTYCIF